MANNIKETIMHLIDAKVTRDGVEALKKFLLESSFFEDPASTKYHLSHAGGLSEHSLHVYDRLYSLMQYEYKRDLTPAEEESAVLVGICHDLCKVGTYTVEMRNVKVNGSWTQQPYYAYNNNAEPGHGDKSAFMLMDMGVKLTHDEQLAIRYHMSTWSGKDDVNNVSTAYHKSKLAVLAHMADELATFVDEKEV